MESTPVPVAPANAVQQTDSDAQMVQLWLHGRSIHTQRAYRADAGRFVSFVGRPLQQVTLVDLQAFADSLGELAPASRARALSAVKSLLSFGHRLGYLPFDVGRALRLPSLKNRLAERILPEADVHRMLALEPSPRNRALLRLLYGGGLRVSEICSLVWRDVQPRDEAGQVQGCGNGGETRVVLLSVPTLQDLATLRDGDGPDAPVF